MAFRDTGGPDPSFWPPMPAQSKKSVTPVVRGSSERNGSLRAPEDQDARDTRWRTLAEQTYLDARLFSTVQGEGYPTKSPQGEVLASIEKSGSTTVYVETLFLM